MVVDPVELADEVAEDWTLVASAAEDEADSGLEDEAGLGLEAATLEVAAAALLVTADAWVVGAEAGVVTVNDASEAIVPS